MVQTKERIQNFILFFSDLICTVVSFYVAGYIWLWCYKGFDGSFAMDQMRDNTLTIFVSYILLAIIDTDSDDFTGRGYLLELKSVVKKEIFYACIIAIYELLRRKDELFPRGVYVITFVFAIITIYVTRIVIKRILINHNKSANAIRMLVITRSDRAERDLALKKDESDWMRRLDAFIIIDQNMVGQNIDGVPVVASAETMMEYIRLGVADEVYIDIDYEKVESLRPLIMELEDMGITVHIRIDLLDTFSDFDVALGTLGGSTVATFAHRLFAYKKLFVKRAADIVGGLVGLCIMLVCLPFVAIAIKIDSPGQVFFKQRRVGKGGRYFNIYKFRSMYMDAEDRKKDLKAENEMQGPMFKITNDQRITRVGSFLRKTSIDELPQFINVLKGDMSLVGTRPPTIDEFKQYAGHHRRRLTMKPGITGMWQAYGRNTVTDFEDVVKMDLQYIDNWSLTLDIKILFKTVITVFKEGGK